MHGPGAETSARVSGSRGLLTLVVEKKAAAISSLVRNPSAWLTDVCPPQCEYTMRQPVNWRSADTAVSANGQSLVPAKDTVWFYWFVLL